MKKAMVAVSIVTVALVFLMGLMGLPPAFAAEGRPVVLFDQTHSQFFSIEKDGDLNLSGLASVFREARYEVRSRELGRLTDETLAGVDLLVISGPFATIDLDDADSIVSFVERGGGLAVMAHISPPLMILLDRLGMAASSGSLRETEDVIGGDAKKFFVTRLAPHPLTKGMSRFAVHGAWGLRVIGGTGAAIAFTSAGAWVDVDGGGVRDAGEEGGEYAVAVAGVLGKGRFVVFGDDAIFQNAYLRDENARLAANLAAWLKPGK